MDAGKNHKVLEEERVTSAERSKVLLDRADLQLAEAEKVAKHLRRVAALYRAREKGG